MERTWPILALLLATGCFGSHGTRDGGAPPPPRDDADVPPPPLVDADVPPPRIDAGPGVCRDLEGYAQEIVCVAPDGPDQPAIVEVTSAPAQCCERGAVSGRVRRTSDRSFEIGLRWIACECCEACRCLGPLETTRFDLGVLAPGTYTVSAGGSACTLEIPEVASCRPHGAALRMPRHAVAGQPIPLTLTEPVAAGCGCSPRAATSRGPGHVEVGLEVCDCCDECECVDPGYQASAVLAPFEVGSYELYGPDGAEALYVHDRDICQEARVDAIEIVLPSDDLIVSGPRLVWARVTGESLACCAPPAAVVVDRVTGAVAYDLVDCLEYDCDCAPSPRPIEAWLSLGELAPGAHRVEVGGVVQSFTVPR